MADSRLEDRYGASLSFGDANPFPDSVKGVGAQWHAGGNGESPEEASRLEATLRERARRFAQLSAQAESGNRVAVVLFRLREESYAVELRFLRRVQLTRGLTAVPCTPPYVAGILNVRGEVVTVLDLANALGMGSPSALSDSSRVLLVELPELKVGLLVDEVLGDRSVDVDKLDRALSGREFTRGVADASIVFLNLEQLLSGGRFDVQDEVT